MGLRGAKTKTRQQVWEKLQKTVTINPETNCWLVTRGRSIGIGYKMISINYLQEYAHRFAYEMAKGRITDEVVRHTCDTPNCINPEHLLQGSHKDNVQDKIDRGRQPRGIGHPDAVLNSAQVIQILNSTGKTYQQLADEYGISRGGIHNIKSGRTWSHVTGLPKIK